ncbi:type VI secretion system tip protein VgrG [Erwinia sp. BC051422]|uniref:type VI secretion system Vgr family protein n=1 Tax=Erwinia wuhanensis TaxID=3045167 RepID=UPI00265341DA|nr:type VI secretion system Vgr family protein [Erwinia sp. BC051422]MDN8541648.1 type VI secretion system tip protein VgrG [Erwinia sp. BC051422]
MSINPVSFFSHSHHLLAVRDCQAQPDVLAFRGEERLSEPFSWRVEFTSADPGLTREAMLMKPASLTLRAPVSQGMGSRVQRPVRVVQGVVTGFERLGTSADQTLYAVTLRPRLALLSRSRHNAIYQDMSVPQIVEKILRERHGMRGQDFVFTLAHDYPRREQVMQYGEDDLAFITRLLGEVGIWFRFTPDARLHIDVVEFYDGRQGHVKGLTLPAVPPSGMHDAGSDSVWNLASRSVVVEKSVSGRDYNYRNAMQDMNVHADVTGGDDTTCGEAYSWGGNYLTPGEGPEAAPESGTFYARLRHERCLNGQTRLSAVTSCPTLAPGSELSVTGGEEVAGAFRSGMLVTAVVSTARRDRSFETELDGIPLNDRYGFRPIPLPPPVMAGTLPARVTSTTVNDTYGHIDRDGRYRVSMMFDRAAWETGFESLWVRQARAYAGDTYGLHLPLLAGTEVAIAFEHGHPDRPYIAGALHDSAHGDHVTIRNFRRNVLRTPANNKLRMDDTRGQEHVKLSTEYGGKSQLNLGHLVDGEKQKRGEGFELRSDGWGAIRAGKGLFITADAQAKAQGEQLEMQAALGQLQQALSQAQALSSAVETAKAELADIESQKSLLAESLTELKKSALLLSAPAGIAQATPASLQLAAGENIISTSGKNTDFSVVKKFTVAAGEAISLFANKLGIKLFASRGKVEIQAQSDEMTLDALKDIRISSSEGKLFISAKQEIILTSGGGYIRIADGSIECSAPDNIIQRAAVWQKFGGQSINVAAQQWSTSDFAVTPTVLRLSDRSPVAGQQLIFKNGDGIQPTLPTSASGAVDTQKSINIDSLSATLPKKS